MMSIFIIFLFSSSLHFAANPISTCFYNQKFSIINATPLAVQPGGYSYAAVWEEPQINITASSFSLIGYKMQYASSLMSYNAQLANLTSVGVTFILYPLMNSTIMQMEFSIVLLKTCTGYIELVFANLSSSILYQIPRVISYVNTYITLSQPILSDTSNYRVNVFLSAFQLTSQGSSFQIRLRELPLTAGLNTAGVQVLSNVTYNNHFSNIWLTYIIFYIPSFNYQVGSYSLRYGTNLGINVTAIPPNFGIPSQFNPNLTKKCILSLTYVLRPASSVPSSMTVVNTGSLQTVNLTSVAYLNHWGIWYSFFCLRDCDDGYIVMSYSSYICTCTQYLWSCSTCIKSPTVLCTSCNSPGVLMAAYYQCFTSCFPGYYINDNRVCETCRSQCITCNNNQTCLTCRKGRMVEGGCTEMGGCLEIIHWNNPFYCLRCDQEYDFYLNGTTCKCKQGSFMITNKCIKIKGCITAVMINTEITCIMCNVSQIMIKSEGICICKEGYQLIEEVCIQICGDGKVFGFECDDGNIDNNDGCSSKCQIERFYKCINGSDVSPSICKYYGKNIHIEVKSINKAKAANQGIFSFKITPILAILAHQYLNRTVFFECNQSILLNKVIYDEGKIIVYVSFFEDLQGKPAKMTIFLNNSHFQKQNLTISFLMISQKSLLVITNNYQRPQIFQYTINGLAFLSLLIFTFSIFVHKMIGVELMHALQIIYLSHLNNQHYTEQFGLLKYLSPVSWNIYPFDGTTNIDSVWQNVPFNSKAEQNTIFIMGSLTLISVIVCVLPILKVYLQLGHPDQLQHKVNKYPVISKIIYQHFLFPLGLGFLPVFLLITIHKSFHSDNLIFLLKILMFAETMVLSIIYFIQQQALFISQRHKSSFYGVQYCSKNYIAVHILILFVSCAIISQNSIHLDFSLQQPQLALQIVFLLWKIKNCPYQQSIHNQGIITNSLTIVFYLIWTTLRNISSGLLTEDNEYLFLIVLVILLFSSIVISTIRTSKQLINKCSKNSKQLSLKNKLKQNAQQLVNQRQQHQLLKTMLESREYESLLKPIQAVNFAEINKEAYKVKVRPNKQARRSVNKYLTKISQAYNHQKSQVDY